MFTIEGDASRTLGRQVTVATVYRVVDVHGHDRAAQFGNAYAQASLVRHALFGLDVNVLPSTQHLSPMGEHEAVAFTEIASEVRLTRRVILRSRHASYTDKGSVDRENCLGSATGGSTPLG